MNFGLSAKYSMIDFEEVSISDLVLIGGGCGGGGGGSTTVSQSQAQQQANTAVSQAGLNANAYATVSSPTASGSMTLNFGWSPNGGPTITGTATVSGSTGHVEAGANASLNTGGGFWSSIGNFFASLFGFGSH